MYWISFGQSHTYRIYVKMSPRDHTRCVSKGSRRGHKEIKCTATVHCSNRNTMCKYVFITNLLLHHLADLQLLPLHLPTKLPKHLDGFQLRKSCISFDTIYVDNLTGYESPYAENGHDWGRRARPAEYRLRWEPTRVRTTLKTTCTLDPRQGLLLRVSEIKQSFPLLLLSSSPLLKLRPFLHFREQKGTNERSRLYGSVSRGVCIR